jgi:hypothetical protein
MKKFEVSPTNRYYGLPVDGATPVPTEPRTRERKGGAIGHGKDAGDIGGGQMGSFQIQSRTGLGLGVGGGIGGRRGDRHAAEDGGQVSLMLPEGRRADLFHRALQDRESVEQQENRQARTYIDQRASQNRQNGDVENHLLV